MASEDTDRFVEKLMDDIADTVQTVTAAPTSLKARVYSALLRRQTQSGLLESLTRSHARGHELCVFEQLVRISPVGETAKSLNICRVCHARVLAERLDNSPIYWPGCPYAEFKKS
jgi:hypothetical protein